MRGLGQFLHKIVRRRYVGVAHREVDYFDTGSTQVGKLLRHPRKEIRGQPVNTTCESHSRIVSL
jgi:hypothetical protein